MTEVERRLLVFTLRTLIFDLQEGEPLYGISFDHLDVLEDFIIAARDYHMMNKDN